MDEMKQKDYLGDGVYVNFDGFALVLTTEDGITVTNCIVLEPDVYRALLGYVERLKTKPAVETIDVVGEG